MADQTPDPAFAASARSDAGRVRTNNEDLPVLDRDRGIVGVIDGVGGHAAGETAAAIARDVILQRLARPLGTPAERVREAIALANNEIYRRASASPELTGMTCVATIALVAGGRLTIGHVGDSRAYKIRASGVAKLTHDHSPIGEREDAGELDERAAMRHPRRHEVFRDVGSALRDKDEPDYVEVVETTFEDDAAVLVCSDGLTDMVPSTTIERVVRTHAGDVEAVTEALVAAANDAGGRDNVTVVYAEGQGFANRMAESVSNASTPVTRTSGEAARGRAPSGSHRAGWFVFGVLVGLAAAALAVWRLSLAPPVGGRTIVAAAVASDTVDGLATAVLDARPGDVIRLEPGTYAESVDVPDGVSLRARVPGASTFVRPPTASGDWIAIVAGGLAGGTISGLRIASTPDAPVDVGVRVSGQGRAIELLQIDGATRAGVELLTDASATLMGTHVSGPGTAIALHDRSRLEASDSIFLRAGQVRPLHPGVEASRQPAQASDVAAIVLHAGASAVLRRNAFVGFGPSPVAGLPASERDALRADNVVVNARPDEARRTGGDR